MSFIWFSSSSPWLVTFRSTSSILVFNPFVSSSWSCKFWDFDFSFFISTFSSSTTAVLWSIVLVFWSVLLLHCLVTSSLINLRKAVLSPFGFSVVAIPVALLLVTRLLHVSPLFGSCMNGWADLVNLATNSDGADWNSFTASLGGWCHGLSISLVPWEMIDSIAFSVVSAIDFLNEITYLPIRSVTAVPSTWCTPLRSRRSSLMRSISGRVRRLISTRSRLAFSILYPMIWALYVAGWGRANAVGTNGTSVIFIRIVLATVWYSVATRYPSAFVRSLCSPCPCHGYSIVMFNFGITLPSQSLCFVCCRNFSFKNSLFFGSKQKAVILIFTLRSASSRCVDSGSNFSFHPMQCRATWLISPVCGCRKIFSFWRSENMGLLRL